MEARYNVPGAERKRLAHTAAEILGAEVRYLGTPTYTYEIGRCAIDRNGLLTYDGDMGLEEELRQKGFEPTQGESGMTEMPESITIEIPYNGDPAILIALLHSKATLINAALGEDAFWYSPAPEYSPYNPGGWYGTAPCDNTLPIEIADGTAKFEWLVFGTDPETVQAWTAFLAAAVKFSAIARRVTAKDNDAPNQKFAFRVFLIRLGLVGIEHKETRRLLLRKLSGCSAWKNGRPAHEEAAA